MTIQMSLEVIVELGEWHYDNTLKEYVQLVGHFPTDTGDHGIKANSVNHRLGVMNNDEPVGLAPVPYVRDFQIQLSAQESTHSYFWAFGSRTWALLRWCASGSWL